MIPENPSAKRYWYGPFESYESRSRADLIQVVDIQLRHVSALPAVKILSGESHEGETIHVERGKERLEFTALAPDQPRAP